MQSKNQFFEANMGRRPSVQEDHETTVDSSQKAYTGIRRMLYHKELIPGQKIACRELAERLKMSPTPIIQALKWLEIQGFVRHEPNRGYYMAPFSLGEIEQIYELRELLEPSLLPDVTRRLDEEGVKQLKTALDAHLSAVREFYLKERLFKNTEFHLTLAALSGKETQLRILRNVLDLLFLKYGGNYLTLSTLDAVDREHREIFDCVVSRNPKGAKKALLAHITNVKRQVLANLRQILKEQELLGF
jgi:DNA-binding GntR family transcriptional regulator